MRTSDNHRSIRRFITCGSVDDGKSTLIGRLMYECGLIYNDQLGFDNLDLEKKKKDEDNFDFSSLLDGLAAERDQGITIDIAYRYFYSNKKKYIIADTPGHEQYTRNMVTAASTADMAVILIDVNKGVLSQTKRHFYVCNILGVKRFIITVNKMDTVNYDQERYESIVSAFKKFAKIVGVNNIQFIPISARGGDNLIARSSQMEWYNGESLLGFLERDEQEVKSEENAEFILPVQYISRGSSGDRTVCGRINSGSIKVGDELKILPSRKTATIKSINGISKPNSVGTGHSAGLTFMQQVDCSRGDILVNVENQIQIADQFNVKIVWMNEAPLIPGRSYWLKIGSKLVSATVSKPKYKLNVHNLEQLSCNTLELNEVGASVLTLDRKIPFLPYHLNKELGGFILIDKVSNLTVGAGLIEYALARSQNIFEQEKTISTEQHAKIKNQKSVVLWFTGLSGAGKSTIANAAEKLLYEQGRHTFLLDGDNLRLGLNKDLGFTESDRIENIRRVGEVARLMADAGLIVFVALISPFAREREMVSKMIGKDKFCEIFVDVSIEVAEYRDVKGLYKKARQGQIGNFTGITSPYERPECPDIYIDTTKLTCDEGAELVVSWIEKFLEKTV